VAGPPAGLSDRLLALAMRPGAEAELESVLRAEAPQLEAQQRAEVLRSVLAGAAAALDGPGGFSLSRALHVIRDTLRDPLPQATIAKDFPQAVQVETLSAVDGRGFFISGWTRDEDGTFDRLTVVSPEGYEADLSGAFRMRRRDVEDAYGGSARPGQLHGFAKFFVLPARSPLENGWLVELRDATGAGVQTEAPPVLHDAATVKEHLLAQFGEERTNADELRAQQLLPALDRLQDRERDAVEIESVVEYGAPPPSPAVSVVVALYRRIDFLEHHLLHFAQDPAMRQADLIYVLDSPELAGPLADMAAGLHAFHGIPFRIVHLTRNAGYATANNLGASVARGRLLLLLNSDVIPDRPGWLERMASFYDSTPGIGALGPKLLFEDESVQHAGMYFEREPVSGLWGDLHYFKGVVPRDFPAANVTRPVPAVTGACLMIERALFEELGGLDHRYARGGYEDSELCLRLAERGRTNWYLGDVELYHLEGQVHPTPARHVTTKYATWLQTRRWGELIERVMAEQAPPGESFPAKAKDSQMPADIDRKLSPDKEVE
jgi:GT2 family glycosyltransferase